MIVSNLMCLSLAFFATGLSGCRQISIDEGLYSAANHGDTAEMKRLIDEGANVNASFDGGGNTPLIAAVRSRNVESVKLLLKHGADPNTRESSENKHVLELAKYLPEIRALLINAGAKDVSRPTKVVYQYKGKGERPKFQPDPSRKIDVIKVGHQTSSSLGMTVKGPCAFVDTYELAEIKFADGTTRTYSSVTLEGWAGYQASLVKVN